MKQLKESSILTGWVFFGSTIIVVTFMAVLSSLRIPQPQQQKVLGKKAGCTTIQDGTLLTSNGELIVSGFDQWGYNYQARMFNGGYCDSYRDADWCQPYKDVNLLMKWNEAWLSNMDCDDDGKLDRYRGFDSYIGSGAWLTNHQDGSYVEEDGNQCYWNYFVKIVAAPADATPIDGVWYGENGTEIGEVIWGSFAIVQQVENDPCAGLKGLQYRSPSAPGFGRYIPKPTATPIPEPTSTEEPALNVDER